MQVRRFTGQCLEQLCRSAGSQVNDWNNYAGSAGPQVPHRTKIAILLPLGKYAMETWSPPCKEVCYPNRCG